MSAFISEIPDGDLADAFAYLDDLRATGATNMFGAGPYLVRDLGLPESGARAVLTAWMGTFGAGTIDERALAAKSKAAEV